MLPGFSGIISDTPFEFTLFSQTTASTQTIAWPAVRGSDLAFLIDWAYNTSSMPSAVTPTGFTNFINNPTSGWESRVMYSAKKCDGTETGNITGLLGSTATRKSLYIFRPTTYWDSFTSVVTASDISNVDGHSPLNLASAGTNGPAFIFTGFASSDSNITYSSSVAMDAYYPSGGADRLKSGYKLYGIDSTTANVTLTAVDEGLNNQLNAMLLRINR